HRCYQLCQKLCQLCQPLCQLCQPPFPQPPFLQPPFLQPPLPQPPLRHPQPPFPHPFGHAPSSSPSAEEPCCSLNATSETPARISLRRSATLTMGASSFRFTAEASDCTVDSRAE